MKQQLLCSVAAIAVTAALAGPVKAADLPLKASPIVVRSTWTGFYIGGHLGYGEGRFPTVADLTDLSRGDIVNDPSGWVGGLHAGYNWQHNSFVFGLEADVSAVGWSKHTFFGTAPRGIQNSVDLLATLRGRVGLAFDRALIYATGGLAYTQAKFLSHSPGGTVHGNGTFDKWGYVLGGGAEWKYNPNLSFRLEGLWYKFDDEKFFVTDHIWRNEFREAWVVRGGLSYHF